jgi:signal transduction histidine kinase/DNA-binding response OmpR family regulator
MTALLNFGIEVAFALCFVAAAWTAIRHHDPIARNVAYLFATLGSFLIVSILGVIFKPLPDWATILVLAALLAEPLLALRLVDGLHRVRAGLMPLSVVAFVAVVAAVLATLPTIPPAVLVLALAYFVGLNLVTAGYFAAEAMRRRGSARIRLLTAAAATGSLAVALLAAQTTPAADDAAGISISQLATLLAAVAYLAAFLPPRPLRRLWQATAAADFTRALVRAPADDPVDALWSRLADIAARTTGGQAFVVTSPNGSTAQVVAASGGAAAEAAGAFGAADLAALGRTHGLPIAHAPSVIHATLARLTADRYVSTVPLSASAALLMTTAQPSLFAEDDLDLLEVMGSQAAMLVERRRLLADQEAMTSRLSETVAALGAANAAKSDFLASMSHELRTPLNAIIGFSDLMREEPGDDGRALIPRDWIEHTHRSGQHLLGLINDVLDLSKVEAGRLELHREPVDVAAAAGEVVAGLRPLAEPKHLLLETRVPSVVVDVDRGRLRQILYNLLSNAIKFTPDGGRVTVEATAEGHLLRLSVSDTGVGIASTDLTRVFEEFRQVGDHGQQQGGTGLGLALTRRLVEAHGGRIELTSEVGAGSTFTVILPLQAPVPAPAGDPVSPAPERTSWWQPNDATVLVIEDELSAARLLREHLETEGYRVVLAGSGELGLAEARRSPPVAIVLDVLLPGIDGWEVLRQLKSDPALRDVPVVIVTIVDEREVGLALGAADYLVKPVKREALLACLSRFTLTTKVQTRVVRILAVDDERQSLDLVAAALEPSGFKVDQAQSGAAALEAVDHVAYDLVICDLVMPGMDGFEVIGAIKSRPATAELPILVLTGHQLTAAERQRLNGHIVGVAQKGPEAVTGLRRWLARVAPFGLDAPSEETGADPAAVQPVPDLVTARAVDLEHAGPEAAGAGA